MEILHIAVPKGRLFEGVHRLLEKAGYRFLFRMDRTLVSEPMNGIQIQFVKPRAIPQLVHHGYFDAGFTGLDLLREASYPDLVGAVDLCDRPVEIVVAAPKRLQDVLTNPPARPLSIATEYPETASRWALEQGFAHVVLQTYGSTEGYAYRVADIVIDCVETGKTMADNDLVEIARIGRSTTHLIAKSERTKRSPKTDRLAAFIHKMQTTVIEGQSE